MAKTSGKKCRCVNDGKVAFVKVGDEYLCRECYLKLRNPRLLELEIEKLKESKKCLKRCGTQKS